MPRKRITEVLPFLLPLRKWQRKKLFYLKMQMDGSRYAKSKAKALLPYKVYETSYLSMFITVISRWITYYQTS